MHTRGTPTRRARDAEKQRAGRRGDVFVVGYDGSPSCDAALVHAAARAGRTGRVVVVHVAEQDPAAGGHIRGRALLDSLLAEGCAPLMNTDFERHLYTGHPAEQLVEAALEHEADEIIVGAPSQCHQRPDGTATMLLRSSPLPVTLVPASEPRAA